MELWIRSQDRESLTKVNNVQYTYEKGSLYTDVNGKHYIGTYYDNLKILGTYKTKERALEVLDEIQGQIRQNECLKTMITKLNNIKGEEEKIGKLFKGMVYEMPKE